ARDEARRRARAHHRRGRGRLRDRRRAGRARGRRQGRRRRVRRQHRSLEVRVGGRRVRGFLSPMTRYSTLPPIPDRLSRLEELAVDLWWSWNPEARLVFRSLDYTLWRTTAHNPVRMLWLLARTTLEKAAGDPAFLPRYDRAVAALDATRG